MWRLHRVPATAAASVPPPPLLPRRDVGESCVTLISSISLATFFLEKTVTYGTFCFSRRLLTHAVYSHTGLRLHVTKVQRSHTRTYGVR